MSDKKFLGKGWAVKFGVNISLSKKDLDTIPVDKWGCIKLSVVRRREPDPKTKAQYYVIEDTYKKPVDNKKQVEVDDLQNFDKDVPF